MKKYLRLICSVCKRTADRLVDQTHFAPDKCTITLKCEGRLFPSQYISNAGITSAPEVGITDWRARGTPVNSQSQLSSTSFLNTSTGALNQIVLAVQSATPLVNGDEILLKLNQRVDSPKAYKQFVYRQEGSFTSISGVESGLEKKTLRYSPGDTIQVFLNGVKLEVGMNPENYQLYDGSNSNGVPPNTVNFNTQIALPGVTQVDVIVSQAAQTTQIPMTFKKIVDDESRRGIGSWENVDSVKMFNGASWQTLYLFVLDLEDATSLKLNTILTADTQALLNGSISIPSSSIHLLLARSPHSNLDRYLNLTIPLSTLTFERDYLKYFTVDGLPVLYVTDTAVSAVYPLLQANKFRPESTIKTPLQGVSNQVLVDGAVIVGPDA